VAEELVRLVGVVVSVVKAGTGVLSPVYGGVTAVSRWNADNRRGRGDSHFEFGDRKPALFLGANFHRILVGSGGRENAEVRWERSRVTRAVLD
jgi:hypothetical protein